MVNPTAAKETKGEGHCCKGSSRHQATGSRPGEQRTRTKKGTKAKSGLGQKKRGGGKQNKITKAGFLGCPGHSSFCAGGTGNAQRAAKPRSPWLAGGGSSTVEALVALLGRHRGSRSPWCLCAHPAALAPPVPPAVAQVAPAGSLPHTGAFLQLPGMGAQSQQSPWSQSPRVCNRDRKNQEEKPGFSYPQGWEGRWQLVLFHR